MQDIQGILKSAASVLLVDWPNPGVPRALIEAGLTVFGFSPGRYSKAAIVAEHGDIEQKNIFPPRNAQERGYLAFQQIAEAPRHVDIVYVYRPVLELEGIVANHVLPLGAKVLWMQPPLRDEDFQQARRIAEESRLTLIVQEL